jgi:hypothetical protein
MGGWSEEKREQWAEKGAEGGERVSDVDWARG